MNWLIVAEIPRECDDASWCVLKFLEVMKWVSREVLSYRMFRDLTEFIPETLEVSFATTRITTYN